MSHPVVMNADNSIRKYIIAKQFEPLVSVQNHRAVMQSIEDRASQRRCTYLKNLEMYDLAKQQSIERCRNGKPLVPTLPKRKMKQHSSLGSI